MITDEEIRKAHADFINRVMPNANTILAKVISVNEGDCTCVLIDDDEDATEYIDVRLRPVIDGKQSVTIIPKLQTWALAVRIEFSEDYMVIAVGEAEKFIVKIGATSFEINANGFLIKKNNDTLKQALTLIIEAVNQIAVLYGNNPNYLKLQQAQTKINNLLQ
jgi:hypothetical protein